mmetsp:Transcript_12866/g.25889  ORF Transcript_12866/g.25889 Transcript_12866/m.25889 type:complete len:892 (+) Transcript_12866:113-2788(+)
MAVLDEAFGLLKDSKMLEGKASMDPSLLDQSPSAIIEQSADKMFEACYLMKQHLRTLSQGDDNRQILEKNITEYEHKADLLRQRVVELDLMEHGQNQNNFVASSTAPSVTIFEDTHLHSVDSPATMPNASDRTDGNAATSTAEEAKKIFAIAINHDENKNIDEAIDNYVNTAGLYLKAVKILQETDNNNGSIQRGGIETSESSISPESHKVLASWKQRIEEILDRVEELKKLKHNGKDSEHEKQESNLTSYELDVLVRSSQLTSRVFLPWSDKKAKIYDFSPPQKFVDPDGKLELSEKQKADFYKWARPEEVMGMRSSTRSIKMIDKISPYTIKQHCVSDCSFIAGLCISAAYEKRLEGRRLVSSLIYPQDSNGTPIYNPQGVYMVKLWLNGVARQVIVDDYLPVDNEGRLLCSHTVAVEENKSNLELWVPILEKAYMKMCGGYDFPGSNSGVDLFSLTGWIPEKLFLPEDSNDIKDFETPIERCWERVFGASSSNDCLITMATSKDLTEEQASSVGLHTDHAYAVLKIMKSSNGTRLLQLKNPWARSGWNKTYSAVEVDANSRRKLDCDADAAAECDGGVFWITWTDATIYLRNIHMSWNPELLPFKNISHGLWKAEDGPKDDLFYVSDNPQFTITFSKDAVEKNATVWVLLSRHVTKQEQKGSEAEGYLAADVHRIKNSTQRVYYPGGDSCILTGGYTNNQHNLIRYDANGPEDRLLSIVLRQYNKSIDLGFTLSCYCTEAFRLGRPAKEMALYRTLRGKWELRGNSHRHSLEIGSAGGPPQSGSFGSNPQWKIKVLEENTKMQFKCKAGKNLAINMVLVKTTRKRIHHLHEQLLINTGYRFGFSVSDVVSLPPGMYSLVASTTEVGGIGSFVLQVLSSSEQIEISEIV